MTSAQASRPLHCVSLVRPGPQSLAWLRDAVRSQQNGDPLAPVTVVAASPYIAAALRQSLAEIGCANVRFSVQLRPVAERIARAVGISGFDTPLTGPLEAAAIRVAVRELGSPVLQPLADHRALQESLGALFRELGHLDEPEATLAALANGGSVAAAATRAYESYSNLTTALPDVPRQLRMAADVAARAPASPGWAQDVGALVLYLLPRVDAADQRLLEALGRHLPIVMACPYFDDVQADDLMRETADGLARPLRTQVVRSDACPTPPDIQVLSAPDPEEEAKTVVRRLLEDLESGVPLWRMAVHYTAEDPYAPLVRETLDAARIPWHSALGRPAAAGWAACSLLGLLSLRERRFAREAVLEWLVARAPVTTPVDGDRLPDVPVSVWDRLSRRAQVLESPGQWIARFERLILTLEAEERERDDWRVEAHAHEVDVDTPRPARESDDARAIVAAVKLLERDTRPPAEPATWEALVEWARGLRSRYVLEDPTWPESECQASAALDGALESLCAASALEPTTTVAVFGDSLAAALEARRLNEGQSGVGVLVGPVGSSTGATFDQVYVLGMAEGLLPAKPQTDPLLPASGSADPLRRRDRQRQADRRAMLASMSSADGHSVLLSYARTDGAARASYPSRWLLEQAAQLEGVPTLYAADLPRLVGPDHPWMERIASAYDGLQRCTTPLNLADLRLHDVVKWRASGRKLVQSSLAERSDLSFGRALRAAGARRSSQFTEFDGNLGAIAAISSRVRRPFASDGGASSATSLERWAGCPFLYFMVNVLRVEATERPEDEWTVTALDKGSLVHAVLEQFFRERFEQQRSGRFTTADHDRLEQLAWTHLRDLEDQGRTGHPLAWDNARAVIVKDLHMLLEREDTWRTEDDLEPALFERTFGDSRDPDTLPAVVVPLENGVEVRFRGAMDRVDFSPTGATRRALVIDYKTGGAWGYDGLADDPVLDGRHVQLALYARAVRSGLAEGQDLDEIRAEYRFVSSKGGFERRQIVVDNRADARLVEVVQQAANGIRDGVFLPRPGKRSRGSFENCRFCEYDRICSTTRDEAWQRKRSNASFVPLERLQ